MSSNNVKCSICFEMRQCLHFTPCGHECVCPTCYIENRVSIFANVDAFDPFTCPLCRVIVRHVAEWTTEPVGAMKPQTRVVDEEHLTIATNVEEQLKFFNFLKVRFRNRSSISIALLSKVIHKFYKHCFITQKRPILLSVKQCEMILKLATVHAHLPERNSYILRKMLVASCVQPWLVNRDIGSEGVCYHGNLGERPTIVEYINLLYRNHYNLMKIKYFS